MSNNDIFLRVPSAHFPIIIIPHYVSSISYRDCSSNVTIPENYFVDGISTETVKVRKAKKDEQNRILTKGLNLEGKYKTCWLSQQKEWQ